jgi:hypothetical protein
MSLLRAYLVVGLTGLIGTLLGGIVGVIASKMIPEYIRALFPQSANDSWFEPLPVGLGAGMTRGLWIGLAVGSIVLITTTWHRTHRGGEDGAGW